jgi:tetratricopeptide (TPR) repeat protein
MQGRMPDAIPLIEIACAPGAARIPREVESCIQLLELLLQRGRADVVLAQAETLLGGLATSPDDPTLRGRVLGVVARACVELRQPEEAERWARQALALNAQSTAAWRVFATLAFEAKQYSEAIQWWERCVEYRQTGPDILLPLAIAYQRTGQLDEARRHVARVLAADPQNASAQRLSRELRSG